MDSELQGKLGKLLDVIVERSYPLFMTWEGIESRVLELLNQSNAREITTEMIERGKTIISKIDIKRKNNLKNNVTDWD